MSSRVFPKELKIEEFPQAKAIAILDLWDKGILDRKKGKDGRYRYLVRPKIEETLKEFLK